jgi:hypothetical protein
MTNESEFTPEANGSAAQVSKPADPKTNPPCSTAAKKQLNYGTVIFGAFSALSLLVALAKGIVPLYLGESALWAGFAWYWHKKNPQNETAKAVVLFLAVAVACGEGYMLGTEQSVSPRRSEPVYPYPIAFQDRTSGSSTAAPSEPQSPQPSSAANTNATSRTGPPTERLRDLSKRENIQKPQFDSCQEVAAGSEMDRRPTRYIGGLELLKASIKDEAPFVAGSEYPLKLHNGSNLCLTSIELVLVIQDQGSSAEKRLAKTVNFYPPLAPGEDRAVSVDRVERLRSGDRNVTGLLKSWDLATMYGFKPAQLK